MSKIGATPEPQKGVQVKELEYLQKQNPSDTLVLSQIVNNEADLFVEEQNVDFENFLEDSRKNFEDFCKSAQDEFGNFTKQPFGIEGKVKKNDNEVGHILPIRGKDNTLITINFKEGVITKYSQERKPIGQRKITEEERQLPTKELISKILKDFENQKNIELAEKNNTEILGETSQKQLPFSDNARVVKNNSITLKYEFIETENGYSLIKDGYVVNFRNKDALAFQRDFDLSAMYSDVNYPVERDSKGFYYRGLSAKTQPQLASEIRKETQRIATEAAIYRDLQTRQANGEELKDYERDFMQNFLDSLTPLGLQMNENSEIVDLPTTKKGRRK